MVVESTVIDMNSADAKMKRVFRQLTDSVYWHLHCIFINQIPHFRSDVFRVDIVSRTQNLHDVCTLKNTKSYVCDIYTLQ